MRKLRDELLSVCRAYCAATGMGWGTLSARLLGRGSALSGISQDKDIYSGRQEVAMQWLSNNWPADAVWPADVPRPAPVLPDTAPAAPKPVETSAEVSA